MYQLSSVSSFCKLKLLFQIKLNRSLIFLSPKPVEFISFVYAFLFEVLKYNARKGLNLSPVFFCLIVNGKISLSFSRGSWRHWCWSWRQPGATWTKRSVRKWTLSSPRSAKTSCCPGTVWRQQRKRPCCSSSNFVLLAGSCPRQPLFTTTSLQQTQNRRPLARQCTTRERSHKYTKKSIWRTYIDASSLQISNDRITKEYLRSQTMLPPPQRTARACKKININTSIEQRSQFYRSERYCNFD